MPQLIGADDAMGAVFGIRTCPLTRRGDRFMVAPREGENLGSKPDSQCCRHRRRRALRQCFAAGADRRPLRARKPRACAGDGHGAERNRGASSASASSTRPRFDKANRTSRASARGMGLDAALPIFAEIRDKLNLPVLTDVHERRAMRARRAEPSTCCRFRRSSAAKPIC